VIRSESVQRAATRAIELVDYWVIRGSPNLKCSDENKFRLFLKELMLTQVKGRQIIHRDAESVDDY
jgi:hypothetical protein